jgi:ferric-dicitrate binding protein FerR (iron transport regulator)
MSDDLHEFDLDAWEAPPPPAGLADAVIARARGGAAAVETEAPRSRRWWLVAAAGVLVAGAAAGALFALGGKHGAPADGRVEAARAQRLDLDSASAELDTGAGISWHREGDTLAVDQPRGNASWKVGDHHLRIDAGNGVQIDATGASLRVEVHMLNTDARVLGASTLTAAAVAFVTVVVYEGHVKVGSAGQTVNVEPGATVQVQPGQPPGQPPPLLVGGVDDQRVIELQDKLESMQVQLDALQKSKAAGTPAPAADPCDEDECVLHNYAGACCAKYRKAPTTYGGTGLDRTAISEGVAKVKAEVAKCGEKHPADGKVKVHVHVAPDGRVTEATISATPTPELGACVASVMQGAVFAKTDTGGTFLYPFVFTAPSGPCDADALENKARELVAVGQHADALQKFERALQCKPTQERWQLAFMEACNLKSVAKAKYYYAKISNPDRLVQLCIRNGIGLDQLTGEDGYVELLSTPEAKILVDGQDTGHVTPIMGHTLALSPGKHKVTFVVGAERYTYAVTIKPGETVSMTKNLQ